MKIAILEDNHERQTVMEQCLRDRFHQHEIVFFDSADAMRLYLEHNFESILLIDLDHDLELKPQRNGKVVDPGTGRQVADFLAQRAPTCSVVIHTTNSAAGDGMEFLLRDAGWTVSRVHPYGDMEWIPEVWFRAIRNAIVASAQPRSTSNT